MSKVFLLAVLASMLSASLAFVPATTGRQTAQPALEAFFTKEPQPTMSGTRAVGPPKKKRQEVAVADKPVAAKKPAFSFNMKPAASKAAPAKKSAAKKPAGAKKPVFSFNMPKAAPVKKPAAKKPIAKKEPVVAKKPAKKMAPLLSVFNKKMAKKDVVVKIPSSLMSASRSKNFLDPSDTFDPGAAEVQNKFDDAMWIEEDSSGSRFWAN